MAVQLVTRIPDDLAASVDELVSSGVFASRSDAVRAGLDAVIDRERRAATGRAISAGYRRVPQAGDGLERPDASTAAMIAEEPW